MSTVKRDEYGNPVAGLRSLFNPGERASNRQLRRITKLQEEEIEILHRAAGMKAILDDVQTPKPIRVAYKKKKNPKAFQLHLSDTHSREIVTLKQTCGRNRHNVEIGRERLRSVILQAIDVMKEESRTCEPVHLTVWGGGDYMVNADLHYKMERCVDSEPLVEMEFVYEMLHEELELLWRNSPTDSNSFIGSFSNHGRDSERMIPGLEAARSFDTAIYRRLVKDFTDVRFEIAETNWTVEDVCGFKTMYTHGHAKKARIRKTPLGIMLPNWAFIYEKVVDHGISAWVQGHLHTECILRSNRFCHMQNGSLVGENPFSHSEGYPGEPPSQNLAVVDLKSGTVEKVITLRA